MSALAHDLLWIQAQPAVAAIYFQVHHAQTHELICPDHRQHVRDIARAILEAMSAKSKKLAIHFMRPMSATKRDDVLRFLFKRNSNLVLQVIAVPSTRFQSSLLNGWSAPLSKAWQTLCSAPFDPESYQVFAFQNGSSSTVTEYAHPWIVSQTPMHKQALVVYLQRDMFDYSMTTGIKLVDNVQAAIQGWVDASLAADQQARTLILVGHESMIYGDIPEYQRMNRTRQENTMTAYRTALIKSLQVESDQIPIYVLLSGYDQSSFPIPFGMTLGWLQHRHQLCLSRSVFLSWADIPGLFDDCPAYVSSMTKVFLSLRAKQTRPKWKNDFSEMLPSGKPETDGTDLVHPDTLNMNAVDPDLWRTPLLVKDPGNDTLSASEWMEQDRLFHGVVAATPQVIHQWKERMKNPPLVPHSSRACSSTSTSAQPPPATLSCDDVARQIRLAMIESYVNDAKVYERGESILHTLDELTFWETTDWMTLSCLSHGTANDPYRVSMEIEISSEPIKIVNGFCTCPVGSAGKCKHCVALLLRFRINTDEFVKSAPTPVASLPVPDIALDTSLRTETNVPLKTHRRKLPWNREDRQDKAPKKRKTKCTTKSVQVGSPESLGSLKESNAGVVTESHLATPSTAAASFEETVVSDSDDETDDGTEADPLSLQSTEASSVPSIPSNESMKTTENVSVKLSDIKSTEELFDELDL